MWGHKEHHCGVARRRRVRLRPHTCTDEGRHDGAITLLSSHRVLGEKGESKPMAAAKREKARDGMRLGFRERGRGCRFYFEQNPRTTVDLHQTVSRTQTGFGLDGCGESRPRPRLPPGHEDGAARAAEWAADYFIRPDRMNSKD